MGQNVFLGRFVYLSETVCHNCCSMFVKVMVSTKEINVGVRKKQTEEQRI